MGLDLSQTLVIGISATALFDLSESDRYFREQLQLDQEGAVAAYRQYMREREDADLQDGIGMPLVEALLKLNELGATESAPYVEVVVMSRNSPETGVRVFNNIRSKKLKISRHAFTGGESVTDYLEAFGVDLFLTTSVEDAQRVIDARICAVAIVKGMPKSPDVHQGQLRIAFDGDAVLFDESSELVYKTEGLEKFQEHENSKQKIPLPDGPYALFLRKLSKLQSKFPRTPDFHPIKIGIVTARGAPAELRVINTLRHWGVYVDQIFFLGGLSKAQVLAAYRPHIFFDDQDLHLDAAAKVVPSCRVPYPSDSPLRLVVKAKK